MRVAIVYHFFATYRRPVLEFLDVNEEDEYKYLGDPVNRLMPGVPVWQPPEGVDFVPAKGMVLPGGLLLQRKVIGLAFDKSVDAIIFLGDWHFLTTWISAALSRMTGKTVLFWTHGWRASDRGIKMLIRKVYYRLAHGLLLYGNIARKIGNEQGFSDQQMYVIYNSLDYENQKTIRESVNDQELAQLRSELFESPDDPVLVLVGRIKKSKRVDLLLNAAAQLRESGNPVNVLIVGDGDDLGNLKALAKTLKIPAHFYGSCHDDAIVGRLLMCSQLTVCPAASGLSVIHSMMFGVPVVTSDSTGFQGPEVEAIVPGVSGEFFKDGSAEALAATIKKLLGQDMTQMREGCRAIVDTYYNPGFQAAEIRRAVRRLPPTRTTVADAASGSVSEDSLSSTVES